MAPRRTLALDLLLRLALGCALLACAVLLVDYVSVSGPAFCGVGSGCMAVRRSPFSHVGNAPLPAVAILAELTLFVAAVMARDRERRMIVAGLAVVGAVVGAGLIAVQAFVVEAFCKWCLVVDVSSIVAAIAAVALVRAAGDEEATQPRWLAGPWILGALALLAAPFAWAELPPTTPLPPEVAALAVPGKLTLVNFTDFECPYCRRLAPAMHEELLAHGERVALVRVMAPLALHEGALPAALAYLCVPDAARDAMATALYTAPPEALTPRGVKALALAQHVDEAAYDVCVAAPGTSERLDRDRKLFADLDLAGLPTTFVGERVLLGANPDGLRKLVARGLGPPLPGLPLWSMLVVAAAIGAALSALTARLDRRPTG